MRCDDTVEHVGSVIPPPVEIKMLAVRFYRRSRGARLQHDRTAGQGEDVGSVILPPGKSKGSAA
jgi:hypothetical protein